MQDQMFKIPKHFFLTILFRELLLITLITIALFVKTVQVPKNGFYAMNFHINNTVILQYVQNCERRNSNNLIISFNTQLYPTIICFMATEHYLRVTRKKKTFSTLLPRHRYC